MTARWFFTRVGDVAEHEREAISARTNLYGRATTADFNTAASRRLSIFGRNIHRLDLDAMAIRETGRCTDLRRGAASLLSRR